MLPEIGGRIFEGVDKTNGDYDFFYRQEVIKPALVGLAGPWISGGVEFNWPQHHRPDRGAPGRELADRGRGVPLAGARPGRRPQAALVGAAARGHGPGRGPLPRGVHP